MGVVFVSGSPGETRAFGAELARLLPDGAVVALVGELGAGKTVLVQGAAEGIGAGRGEGDDEGVTSPTFVLVKHHVGDSGRVLIHVDAYRLRGPSDLADIGSDDFLGREGIAFVEWADRVEAALPRPYLLVRVRHETTRSRRIELEGVGESSQALLEAAAKAAARSGAT